MRPRAVLERTGDKRIEAVTILTPFTPAEVDDDKAGVLDLFVRDSDGHEYVIEMQCRNHHGFPERMIYYGARRYAAQLSVGNAYTRLRPVVVLVFTDFELFAELPAYRNQFKLLEAQRGVVFSEHLSVVLVELPKYHT